MLGNMLYWKVESHVGTPCAGKITGMLMDKGEDALLNLLADSELLKAACAEGVVVINSYGGGQTPGGICFTDSEDSGDDERTQNVGRSGLSARPPTPDMLESAKSLSLFAEQDLATYIQGGAGPSEAGLGRVLGAGEKRVWFQAILADALTEHEAQLEDSIVLLLCRRCASAHVASLKNWPSEMKKSEQQ